MSEPTGEYLRRRVVLRWLEISRQELEDLASLHPDIVYRKRPGAYRYFRKSRLKVLLVIS
jgi:hypothetical protein